MINDKRTQEQPLKDGLPELDEKASKSKSVNRKPPIVFMVALVALLGAAGVGVQFTIDYLGVFESEVQVIEEPPVPVVTDSGVDAASDTGFVVNDTSLSDDSAGTNSQGIDAVNLDLSSEQLEGINESLVLLAEELGGIVGKLNKQQDSIIKVMQNQTALLKQFEIEVARREATEKELTHNVKENQRWLGGISNQLKDIGVDVKEASQEFPIVVYGKNVWGEDVFLTIAQKVAPEQTSFLRVGGIVGRWRLIEIYEEKAVFEHFEGNKKEVFL